MDLVLNGKPFSYHLLFKIILHLIFSKSKVFTENCFSIARRLLVEKNSFFLFYKQKLPTGGNQQVRPGQASIDKNERTPQGAKKQISIQYMMRKQIHIMNFIINNRQILNNQSLLPVLFKAIIIQLKIGKVR